MESRKAEALDQLKRTLIRKFGPENEAIVAKEIQAKLRGQDRITIDDLNSLEKSLMQQLGYPGTTGTVKNTSKLSATSEPRRRRASLASTTPDKHRTDLNTSVPLVSDLVPIISGKRRLAPVSSVLFPRFEGTSVNVTRLSPECRRDKSPFDYGLPENQRFQGYSRRQIRRKPDSWGKVIKWDTAKYLQEEEMRKAEQMLVRTSYKKDLDQQVESKKQAVLLASQEEDQFKAALATSVAAFEAQKTQQMAIQAAKREQQKTVLTLLQEISKEQELSKKHAIRLERNQLDRLINQEMQEKAMMKRRKKEQILSIQTNHLKAVASKQQQDRNQRAQSQTHDRHRLDKEKALFEEDRKRAKETILVRDKAVSAANLSTVALQKSKSGTETGVKMEDMKLFMEADKQAAARKQLRNEVLTILARQRKEQEERRKREKIEEVKEVGDSGKSREKMEEQKNRWQQLQAQVEDRERRLEKERDFSEVEMQLNQQLIEAASSAFIS